MKMENQDKKQKQVKIILEILADHANVRGIKGLARFLGCPPTRLYGWIRNGRIYDAGIILTKFPHVNIDWLMTGKGQMATIKNDMYPFGFPENKNQQGNVRFSVSNRNGNEKVVATIQPGKTETDQGKNQQPSSEDQETIDEEAMVEQTRHILRSETVYRGALVSNIRAFYQGVKREEEMAGLETRITQMQIAQEERDIETHNKIDALTKMLIDAGILPKSKKRETSGGNGA